MSVFFLGLGIFAICMIAIALVLLFKGDGSSEQKLMQYFLIGSLIQNAGYLLELMAPGLDAAIVAVKVQYMGSLVVPISYCYFMFNYCYQKKPAIILNFLTIVDIFILGLVFTCDIHNLYYRQINWLVTEEGHGYLSLDYGPGSWVFLSPPHICTDSSLCQIPAICCGTQVQADSCAFFSAGGGAWFL